VTPPDTARPVDAELMAAVTEIVAPRPEQSRAYLGSVTDASGRHAPPGHPTDATAVHPD
jgi:hypothetical protein